MSANIDLAEKIANRITAGGEAQGFPSGGLVLTDLVGNWSMHQAMLTQPLAKVPYKPGAMQAVAKAIAEVYPPPRTSPFRVEEVIGEFKILDPSSPALTGAIDKLSQLNWPDRRTVLKELATSSPSLGGQSYLAILQPSLDALPNVDTAVRAAWMAARLSNGKHEITTEDLSNWVKLTGHVLELPFQDISEVFISIGYKPEEIDGLIADMMADLDDLELNSPATGGTVRSPMTNKTITEEWFTKLKEIVKTFDRTRMDFLEFKRPGNQWYGYYLGTAIHMAIAQFYRAEHGHERTLPGDEVWTNTTPVEKIFNFLISFYGMHGMDGKVSELGRSAARTMPDILELRTLAHKDQPPGWIYEIKSAGRNGEGLAWAKAEALQYMAVLSVFSIPALPGPTTTLGTFGTVPAPGGWVAFTCPVDGAIVYKLIKVPNERYQLKFPQTDDARKRAEITKKIEAAVGAGVAIAVIVALVILLWPLIVQYGWVLSPVLA